MIWFLKKLVDPFRNEKKKKNDLSIDKKKYFIKIEMGNYYWRKKNLNFKRMR